MQAFRSLLFSLCLTFILSCCFSSGAQGAPATQDASLQKLIAQFDALAKDDKRGGRRDLWLSLEEEFQAIAGKSRGESAARAAYYNARSRQELARRSYLPADHREAVSRFKAVADKYGKYDVAPASLYRQGFVLERHLEDHAAAAAVLERLLKSYPRAADVAEAKKLLTQARAAGADAKAVEPGAKKSDKPSVNLKKISWKGKGQRAEITLELDAASPYDVAFTPPDKARNIPGRLHLDIDGAFPSDQIKPGLKPKNLVVSRIRTSHSGDGVRVTLDCDGMQCYTVSSPPKKPQIIQIEVSRKDDIAGGISVADAGKAQAGKSVAAKPQSQEAVLKQLGLTVQTIMLDPGHGGKDPGAMAGNIVERQFTLAMAKRVGALLKKEGFTVIYTRTGNSFISLQDRPDIANNKKADLFISIHANANTNPGVRGLETYYLDSAKTQDAATVAARENAVSVKNISDLQVILTDLMLSSKLEESRHLAKCVQQGILGTLRARKLSVVDNGSRSAPFYVLMGARMPAILVEFGYITNSDDAANLRSERYLQSQAEGLVQGIIRYKKELARIAAR